LFERIGGFYTLETDQDILIDGSLQMHSWKMTETKKVSETSFHNKTLLPFSFDDTLLKVKPCYVWPLEPTYMVYDNCQPTQKSFPPWRNLNQRFTPYVWPLEHYEQTDTQSAVPSKKETLCCEICLCLL